MRLFYLIALSTLPISGLAEHKCNHSGCQSSTPMRVSVMVDLQVCDGAKTCVEVLSETLHDMRLALSKEGFEISIGATPLIISLAPGCCGVHAELTKPTGVVWIMESYQMHRSSETTKDCAVRLAHELKLSWWRVGYELGEQK